MECVMPDLLNCADKYQKVAAEFSDRARGAPSALLRSYYQAIVERYQVLAESELRLAEGRGNAIVSNRSGASAVRRSNSGRRGVDGRHSA
jgi:hypothetical protein